MSVDPAWIALGGTLFGGIGLKLAEAWLGRKKAGRDENRETRRDLNVELQELIARVDKLEDEVTEWRERYYSEQEKRHMLRLQLLEAGLVPADSITVRLVDETTSTPTDTFEA